MKAIAAGAVAAAVIAIVASFGFNSISQSSTDRYAVDYSVRLDKKPN
jgi:hypothetical protein